MCSAHYTLQAKSLIVDVDGSYLYQEQQRFCSQCAFAISLPFPAPPPTGWEPVSADNNSQMSKRVSPVMSGQLSLCLCKCTQVCDPLHIHAFCQYRITPHLSSSWLWQEGDTRCLSSSPAWICTLGIRMARSFAF